MASYLQSFAGAGSIFAIGDIHGCHRQLTTLLDRLPYDSERDTLVFLGDYINRGPDTRRVIETLLNVRTACRNTVFLLGNHEEMLLGYAATGDLDRLRLLQGMGVEATLSSYGVGPRELRSLDFLPLDHRTFLGSLALTWASSPYVFVHADTPPAPGETTASPDRILAGRRLVREHVDTGEQWIVFGHSPLATPLVMPGRIGIDTGAVYGGLLTAVELPALRFHHA